MIYDRKRGEIIEDRVYDPKTTAFLYHTPLGGLVLLGIRQRWFGKVYGLFQKTRRSKKKIAGFAKEYGIEAGDLNRYCSFNDFITRKEERTIEGEGLVAPADSFLTVLSICGGRLIEVKGKTYTVAKLLKDKGLAAEYEGGLALVFRLAVYDYHRYCFPDSGRVVWEKTVGGVLDSVNHRATGKFSLCGNRRKVSLLETKDFGEVVFVEVGAMLVGRIVATHTAQTFQKGDEKGYFEFGGSTLVVLLKKGTAAIDGDIAEHCGRGLETRVKYGEKIGEKMGG